MKHGDELKPGMFVAMSRDGQHVEPARELTRMERLAMALGTRLLRYGARLRDYGSPSRPIGIVLDGKIATHGIVKVPMNLHRE